LICAPVAGAGTVFIIKPGSRKVAGDTLCVALMPLQPAPSDTMVPPIANTAIFQFNLTAG